MKKLLLIISISLALTGCKGFDNLFDRLEGKDDMAGTREANQIANVQPIESDQIAQIAQIQR